MIRRYLFIGLVATAVYYAGYQQLTWDDLLSWLDEKNAIEMIQKTGKELIDFAKENEVAEKAGDVLIEITE